MEQIPYRSSQCAGLNLVPTHCRCRELLLHLITLNDTHTLGKIPLDEGSVRRRDLCLTTHILKRQTSMPPSGIRPRNPRKRAAADLRLRPRGHRERHLPSHKCNLVQKKLLAFLGSTFIRLTCTL